MILSEIKTLADKIRSNVEKVIVGKPELLDLVLTAVISGGHILLDDVPGTGKTVMAKSIARSVDCGFKRVQFTPDLLPSDITGVSVFNQKISEFEFRPGPAFTNILLADEINRATPRTQSALLECMEERQITVDGETRVLEEPFFVIATQNPVESAGAFPLPEAQLDRFLMRLTPGYPGTEGELEIINRFINASPLEELKPVADAKSLVEARAAATTVQVSLPVRRYIVSLAAATRAHSAVTLGVSPRGVLAMLRASQSMAALSGRSYVLPDDVKRLAAPVFAHRLMTGAGYGAVSKPDEIIASILETLPVPTEDPASDLLAT